MKLCSELLCEINKGKYDTAFSFLYPASNTLDCKERYQVLISLFMQNFGDVPAIIISAPGRAEIGGNHTDHQHGNVLTASVNLDTVCIAAPNNESIIRVQSVDHTLDEICLDALHKREDEKGTSIALIRGVAKWFKDHGTILGGFNAYTTTDVLEGSGLSSSAAFEVTIGTTIARLFDREKTPLETAFAGQFAETEYFGKPSGLLDQTASAIGGLTHIDFYYPHNPKIRTIKCELKDYGYNLCIVNTKGSHADLTGEYAAIPIEMGEAAKCFGKKYLRDVDESEFYREFARVRYSVGDRAVLRAIHYFRDNTLAVQSSEALVNGDISKFLANVIKSGRSSFMCLQNVFSTKEPSRQALSLALDLSERLLEGRGAWRVHGGGFAGTIQAFVPDDLLYVFCEKQDELFGRGSCHVLSIRPVGVIEVSPTVKEEFYNGRVKV